MGAGRGEMRLTRYLLGFLLLCLAHQNNLPSAGLIVDPGRCSRVCGDTFLPHGAPRCCLANTLDLP